MNIPSLAVLKAELKVRLGDLAENQKVRIAALILFVAIVLYLGYR